jgi:outer membrane lipoprotein SlyB
MQCRRDAKAEYDQAIAAAKSRASAVPPPPVQPAQPAATHMPPARAHQAAEVCHDCGTVIAISATEKAGEASALGTIAGGIGGALLGNQVGAGSGKDLATLAGAVGGAYAGRVIEEKVKTHTVWTVTVQYANGERGSFDFSQQPGFSVGDVVKNQGDSIVRQLPAPRPNQ